MAITGYRPQSEEQKEAFFLLFKYTNDGIRNVRGQGQRVGRATVIVTKAGGTCHYYLTVAGPYDMVSVVTGISDRDLARLVLALNSEGTVQTTVLKALEFYADEYSDFLKTLPGEGV